MFSVNDNRTDDSMSLQSGKYIYLYLYHNYTSIHKNMHIYVGSYDMQCMFMYDFTSA